MLIDFMRRFGDRTTIQTHKHACIQNANRPIEKLFQYVHTSQTNDEEQQFEMLQLDLLLFYATNFFVNQFLQLPHC